MHAHLIVICYLLTTGIAISQNASVHPIVTYHQAEIEGNTIEYMATTGQFPLTNEEENKIADVFYVYYSKEENISTRPITFAFNGGPGSPSTWIHMGALGPQRVILGGNGAVPKPPYTYTANPNSWIDFTDMVFIDPMLTGFTRPANGFTKTDFLGYENDITFMADFIRQFLNKNNRWSSPKFIAGESYGALRSIGLVEELQDHHYIFINGLMLISGMMSYGMISTESHNDIAHVLRLPSLTATAWYHGKLPDSTNLETVLMEAEEFALTAYSSALMKGNSMERGEREEVVVKLMKLTGLTKEYLLARNLRPEVGKFNVELLKNEGVTIGRLDTRIKGLDYTGTSDSYSFDPSYDGLLNSPYASVFYEYVKNDLLYDYGQLNYDIISGRSYPWNFNSDNRFLDNTTTLSKIMSKNKNLKIWVTTGYFDLGIPYLSAKYSVNQLRVHPELLKNVSLTLYKGGHMFYHDSLVLKKFRNDAKDFYKSSTDK